MLWTEPTKLLEIELEQSSDEGKDVSALKKNVQEIIHTKNYNPIKTEQQAAELFSQIQDLPTKDNFIYREPNDFSEIIKGHNSKTSYDQSKSPFSNEEHYERILGGILGKCIGCLLGKPIEGWSRDKINSFFQETNKLPLRAYLHEELSHEQIKQYHLFGIGRMNYLGDIDYRECDFNDGMPEDDDINYLLMQFKIISKDGINFSSDNVAEMWVDLLPIQRLYTAERIAYRNFVNGILPPRSAYYCNPYREWIGAQIRADFFGYINPGNPLLAAELAWKEARISHVKNGIYGAIWVAVLISIIPENQINVKWMQNALRFIPKKSRFYDAINQVLNWFSEGISAAKAIDRIHTKYQETNIHHWCHVIPNAMIVTVALLWGDNNFEDTLSLALSAGFDTDCNAATVGSILGYSKGASGISNHWIDYLKNKINSSISGMNVVSIRDFAEQTVELTWL